jgi:hypothetical protein
LSEKSWAQTWAILWAATWSEIFVGASYLGKSWARMSSAGTILEALRTVEGADVVEGYMIS